MPRHGVVTTITRMPASASGRTVARPSAHPHHGRDIAQRHHSETRQATHADTNCDRDPLQTRGTSTTCHWTMPWHDKPKMPGAEKKPVPSLPHPRALHCMQRTRLNVGRPKHPPNNTEPAPHLRRPAPARSSARRAPGADITERAHPRVPQRHRRGQLPRRCSCYLLVSGRQHRAWTTQAQEGGNRKRLSPRRACKARCHQKRSCKHDV